jgi:hypothetical protein
MEIIEPHYPRSGKRGLNIFLGVCIISSGWSLQQAKSIDDSGWIVGTAYNSISNTQHALLLTPVPESETCAMLLAGLVSIGAMLRTRHLANDGDSSSGNLHADPGRPQIA